MLTVILPFITAIESTGGTVTAADWQAVINAITSQISVSTVVQVLAAVVTASIGLVFMWWGVRKVVRAIMSAFRTGRQRL